MTQLARLKPHNGKQHKLKTYTVFGIKFVEARGWYEVEDDVAKYLKTVKQVQDGPDSEYAAPAFDVVRNLAEAKSIDEAEKKRVERALAEHANKTTRVHTTSARGRHAPPGAGGALTTDDLKHGTDPIVKKGESFDDMPETFEEDMGGTAPVLADAVDGAEEVIEPVHTDRPTPPASPKAKGPKQKR